MNYKEPLLELDYSAPRMSKRFLIGFFAYILIILLFNLLSSYKNPTIRIKGELIYLQTYEFQNSVRSSIISLKEELVADSTQEVNHKIEELLVHIYQERNYQPIWMDHFTTNQRFSVLMNLLDSSAYFGFPFDYFNIQRIHELNDGLIDPSQNSSIQDQKIELELTTTFAALKFMLYVKHGIIEQDTSQVYLSSIKPLAEIFNQAIESNDFRNGLLVVQPNLVHHRNLLKSLSYFIDLHYSVKYTTPAFIDDKLLSKSLYYAEISASPVFDSINLKAEALHLLEKQFHLPKDSILNIPTHEALVSLLEYKYFLACLNLNRLRKLKHSGKNYLFVNIPEYKLHVVESNTERETFNVIVGTKRTPTPVLSSSIEKVIANPYWTVPRSIAFEMLHKIRKDSCYLRKHGYFVINGREEIVNESEIDWDSHDPLGNRYWLRQMNSTQNALGQIKFVFPNNYSVYLHDTPSKRLFTKEKRTFSHGCIRLENPNKLAQYLTDTYETKNEYNISQLISEKERHVIDLAEKIKIYVQYITCMGSTDLDMVFYPDIYNLDDDEIRATFQDPLLI